MLARQTRNNNGQARVREVNFCGNAANESDSLPDDLRVNCGSTQDQRLTGKEKKDSSIARESTACKIQIESNNSYKIYTAGRPLSRPLEAFCRPADLCLRPREKVVLVAF
jgi:hypothetical protein